MKQLMIDAMAAMMPIMRPLAIAGAALAAVGLLSGLLGAGRFSRLAIGTASALGVFFVCCELAGRWLGMEPTLLFASDPFDRVMYRNQWPFWSVGLALVASGVAARRLAVGR